MRFLILTQYYSPEIGAPQVRLPSIAHNLQRCGHEVEVLTALPNYPSAQIFSQYRGRIYFRETIDGILVHRVWLYAAQGAGLRRLLNYLTFMFSSLVGLLRCRRPDYVFVESPPLLLAIPGFVGSRVWKAKMILNVADLWPDIIRELQMMGNGIVLKLAERLEKWSYGVSHIINAVTEDIRWRLINKKGISPSKVLFLPNGVDISTFNIAKPDEDLAKSLALQGLKVVLCAGTIGYAHAIDCVLCAAEILKSREDIVFVFIGDGSEKSRLISEVDRRGLKNLRSLNASPPRYVARLYSFATAGLATFRNIELLGGARSSKMFPAMACGVPVIYSGFGEGATLIDRAHAGIVVPPENPHALAEAVVRLCDDRELAKKLGLNGRIFVEQNLTWQKLVDDWLMQLGSSNGHNPP